MGLCIEAFFIGNGLGRWVVRPSAPKLNTGQIKRPQGWWKWYSLFVSNSRRFLGRAALILGLNLKHAFVVGIASYGVMVMWNLFLMDATMLCCWSGIVAHYADVSWSLNLAGILTDSRLQLRGFVSAYPTDWSTTDGLTGYPVPVKGTGYGRLSGKWKLISARPGS